MWKSYSAHSSLFSSSITYVGLFFISFLAAFALPLPSSSVLAAAGAFAATGYFDIYTVLVVAFFGNILGDTTTYFLGRTYGEKLFLSVGLVKVLRSKLYTKIVLGLKDVSYSFIFFSRFITTVGPLVGVISGLAKISAPLFFSVSILGEIAYVLSYGLIGYYLGSEWENNISFLFKAAAVMVSLGLLASFIQYRLFKKRKVLMERI